MTFSSCLDHSEESQLPCLRTFRYVSEGPGREESSPAVSWIGEASGEGTCHLQPDPHMTAASIGVPTVTWWDPMPPSPS